VRSSISGARPGNRRAYRLQLVRHFITDEPTPAMVDPLKQKFIDTHGDLAAVTEALIELPEAWATPFTKVRTPYELAIAQFRALGLRYKANETWVFSETLSALNQLLWECGSPEGYSDEAAYWLDPDGMTIRLVFVFLLSSLCYFVLSFILFLLCSYVFSFLRLFLEKHSSLASASEALSGVHEISASTPATRRTYAL